MENFFPVRPDLDRRTNPTDRVARRVDMASAMALLRNQLIVFRHVVDQCFPALTVAQARPVWLPSQDGHLK